MRDAIPAAVLALIAREKVNHAFLAPAILQMLMNAPEMGSADLSRMKTLTYGASPISDELLLRAKALRGGWMHTGDAAYRDAEGFVFTYDRVKDMIVTGGENVYPAEVENAIFGHPAVADVAVVGEPRGRLFQRGVAARRLVVARAGDPLARTRLDRLLLLPQRGRMAEALDGDEAAHTIGKQRRIAQPDIAAQRMADQVERRQPQRLDHLREVGQIAFCRIEPAPSAVAVPAQIRRDDAIAPREDGGDPVPRARVVAHAMHQHQRGSLFVAPRPHVEAKALRGEREAGGLDHASL